MTKPLSPAQVGALHSLATGYWRINAASAKSLAARGYAKQTRSGSSFVRPVYAITDEGRAAHDAIYTPEKIAADAAAEQAEKDARVQAAQEKRARFQAEADRRNAAAHELAALLGEEGRKLLGYGLLEPAKVHNDASGVWGGDTYGRMTNVQILAIVQAALAEAQR